MNVVVNGRERDIEAGTTISALIASFGRDPDGKGVAVAVNGQVVPRSRWGSETVTDDDRIEVLNAVGGG